MARGEGPKKLSSLFEKYRKTLKAPEQSVRIVFVEVVEEILGIVVDEKKLSYSPHTRLVHIKTAGAIRSEILQHKQEILSHVQGRLGEKSAPKDIV